MKHPEFSRKHLVLIWLVFLVAVAWTCYSLNRRDDGWALAFGLVAAFYALVIVGAHGVRRMNRDRS